VPLGLRAAAALASEPLRDSSVVVKRGGGELPAMEVGSRVA